jgi:cell division protein FtsB
MALSSQAHKVAASQLKQANEKYSKDTSALQHRIDLLQSQLVEAGRTKQQFIDENRHLKDAAQ